MITPISSLNMNILNAIGRSDLFFLVDISKLPLTVAALVITIPMGLTAVVIGHFATSFICYFINAYYPGKLFGFGARRQIKEMWRVICSTLVMSAVVFISMIFLPSDLLKLLIGSTLGIAIYVIVAFILRIRELSEIRGMVQLLLGKVFRCVRDF